jgi:hypothetical protein
MKPLIESNFILEYYLPNTNRFNSSWRSFSGGNSVSSIPSAIQFFPALALGLVDQGEISFHKGGGGEYISILAEN